MGHTSAEQLIKDARSFEGFVAALPDKPKNWQEDH